MADTQHSVGYLVCSWSAACTHACTQYTNTNTYAHACKREHTHATHMSPCPWLVVADVSLMHSGNWTRDDGLTELSTALKVNQAITNLDLSSKLWVDQALRVCVRARKKGWNNRGWELWQGERTRPRQEGLEGLS